jgi:hypothetical protein
VVSEAWVYARRAGSVSSANSQVGGRATRADLMQRLCPDRSRRSTPPRRAKLRAGGSADGRGGPERVTTFAGFQRLRLRAFSTRGTRHDAPDTSSMAGRPAAPTEAAAHRQPSRAVGLRGPDGVPVCSNNGQEASERGPAGDGHRPPVFHHQGTVGGARPILSGAPTA